MAIVGGGADTAQAVTALSHFYRAEIQRSNTWRTRLDSTTNWAIITAGTVLTFTFSAPESPHSVLLLALLFLLVFLGIEARRYRYYEVWSYRARLMETEFFPSLLVAPYCPSQEWAEKLAEHLRHPDFPISLWEAVGRRLRRNYGWIFAITGLAWCLKLDLHPEPATSLVEIIARAKVGPIPGTVVVALGVALYLALVLVGVLTLRLHESPGEVLPYKGVLEWSARRRP